MKDAAIEDMMLRKAVVLEFKRPKKKGKKSKAKGLNAKERRQLKIFQLKPEHQKSVFIMFTLSPCIMHYIISAKLQLITKIICLCLWISL